MSAAIAASIVSLLLVVIVLLVSHFRCRHGSLHSCIFISSLPTEARLQLPILLKTNKSSANAEEEDDDDDDNGESGGNADIAVVIDINQTSLPPGASPCTDVQLNKPDGDWLLQEHLPYGYRCKWMQANYGCEKFPPTPLKWQPQVASDGICTYMDHTPVSAARARAARVPGMHYPIIVVFVGDSFLRQSVEAMACRFESLVTVRRVPAQRVKFPKEGPIPQQPLKDHLDSCVNPDERFQNPPYNAPHTPCSDDALMLRFGEDMEIYFLFRASSTLQAVRWFDLKIPDISVIVSEPRIWTGAGGHPRFDLAQLGRWQFNGSLVLITRGEPRGTYPRCLTISVIRLRDDARSDGGHVCLPGVPDDAVRLLLGMIANPTEFGVRCALPEEDYQRDGGRYIPLSSRGQVTPVSGNATATMWGQGFRFTVAQEDRERFRKEWKNRIMPNKTLHDVDDWIEASYNRSYQPGT